MYCSPTHLKLISGSPGSKSVEIKRFAEAPLPEGGMINGIITSEEIMIDFLRKVGEKMDLRSADLTLVIDNNSIRSKVMNVPPVNEATILDFVKREIGVVASGTVTDDIFDYSVLNNVAGPDGAKILAVSVSKTLLTSYKTVVEQAGYKLKNIDIGINSMIKVAKLVRQLEGTSILAMIDGKSLMLSLFEKGEFSLTNRYRLMNAEGTQEWNNEIGGHLSSVIQFQKGQRSDSEVDSVFFAGITAMQVEGLNSSLGYLGIKMEALDLTGVAKYKQPQITSEDAPEFVGSKYILNIGSLLRK